jgi:NAD(P)-dependent dehydrogenase (short-subunit alcohol dehydrogenase family)
MKDFAGKVAAITGAASGIGRSLALELARHGCSMALSDVNDEGLAETAEMVSRLASSSRAPQVAITTQRVDVAQREAVYAWAEQVVRDHGKVNLIFNNAGLTLGATVGGMRDEDFEWLMNINFWGVVHGTRAFLPHLEASGEGHVVNISSVFGLVGVPSQSAYNAAKFAVRGFTEALCQELDMLGRGVSASCVHPGGIKTNIVRAARTCPSVATLGRDPATAPEQFEKSFRTTADEAARTILRGVQKGKRRILVGHDAHVIDAVARLLPSLYQRLTVAFAKNRM